MLKIAVASIFATLLMQSSYAAEIKVISQDPISQTRIVRGECTATLTGTIEPGDVKKIDAIGSAGLQETSIDLSFPKASAEEPPYDRKALALCFVRSDGGNYEEALRIAKYLRASGWIAVVPRNGRCLSACAVAFLGGSLASSNSDGGERAPFRVMDVSALVGFHAPLFPESMDLSAKVPMSLAFEFLRDGMASIRDLRAALPEDDFPGAGATLPSSLLLDMVSRVGSNDFVYVNTIDKAGAYNIRLSGVPSLKLDTEALYRLCNNAVRWSFRLHNRGDAALTSWNYQLCRADKDEDADCVPITVQKSLTNSLRKGVTVKSRHQICLIKGGPDAGDDYRVVSRRINGSRFDRSFEPWATLPHYMPLSELALTKGSIDLHVYRELKPYSKYELGSLQIPSFIKALPGNVLVVDSEPASTGNLVINFLKDSTAEIIWPDGSVDRTSYKLTDRGACFSRVKSSAVPVCGQFVIDKDDDYWRWSFGSIYPAVTVRFQRLGRIAPPSYRESSD